MPPWLTIDEHRETEAGNTLELSLADTLRIEIEGTEAAKDIVITDGDVQAMITLRDDWRIGYVLTGGVPVDDDMDLDDPGVEDAGEE